MLALDMRPAGDWRDAVSALETKPIERADLPHACGFCGLSLQRSKRRRQREVHIQADSTLDRARSLQGLQLRMQGCIKGLIRSGSARYGSQVFERSLHARGLLQTRILLGLRTLIAGISFTLRHSRIREARKYSAVSVTKDWTLPASNACFDTEYARVGSVGGRMGRGGRPSPQVKVGRRCLQASDQGRKIAGHSNTTHLPYAVRVHL